LAYQIGGKRRHDLLRLQLLLCSRAALGPGADGPQRWLRLQHLRRRHAAEALLVLLALLV
jgi:hypothetical protein